MSNKPIIISVEDLPTELKNLSPRASRIYNKQFGRLTALYPSILKAPDGSILWVCQCRCGNYVLRTSADLRRPNNHCCGADIHGLEDGAEYANKLRNELNGKIFNDLLVIGFDHIEGKRIFLKCKCLKCGNITTVRKDSLTSGHKSSCGCIHSKGEQKIEKFLQNAKIIYKREFTFNDLCDKDKLRFDFAIFKKDILIGLIEYQGVQHFQADGNGWNTEAHLNMVQYHDKLKQEYCKKHAIHLYTIAYNENIDKKMEVILNELFSE